MTVVTDPNILAQLEGGTSQQDLKPVTDPAVLSQLEGNAAPQQNQSFLSQMANSPLVNGVLGAGDALTSTLSAGLVNPHNASGTAYNVGKFAGNVGGFLGGGELLDTARAGVEALPYVGQLAKLMGGDGLTGASKFGADALRQGTGTAAYGALTNPDDRLKGAAEGFGGGALGAGLPWAAKGVGAAANFIRPQKYAEQLMDSLSGGKGLEDSGKSLAQDVKNTYEQKVNEGAALYKPVFDAEGDSKIYKGKWQDNGNSAYGSLNPKLFDNYSQDVQDLHFAFGKNPTLQNAHNLQSQLGTEIRQNSKGNLSIADQNTVKGYQKAQSALKDDINNFMADKNPDLASQYQVATKNWAENVVPYIENPKISKMAKGDIENPRNISNIFRNPEADTQKVIDDMGPEASRKILYSELGKVKLTPEKLAEAYGKLESKGLSSYVTPKLSDQFDTLLGRTKARNAAQFLAGGVGGGLLGGHTGIPYAEMLGTLLGAGVGAGAHYLPKMGIPLSSFSNAAGAAYNPLRQAVLANAIPGAQ